VEEPTSPHNLAQLQAKAAKHRRRVGAAELMVKRKNAPEVRVPIEKAETLIGRDPACDIILIEDSASARHARIRRNPAGYFEIQDLGSANGLWSDGVQVMIMTLVDGDTFTVGDTKFTIVVGERVANS
jgi:pSer/pThr/pTyr-binding forkhead associated (FHA) protein